MRVSIADVSYQVEVTGTGSPLMLLHGFTGSSKNWEPFIPLWSRQHQVISMDLLGHGQTEVPSAPGRYAIEQAAADLSAILDQLELKQTSVVGYSMGGRLALTLAVLYPERINSLVLESSSPGLHTSVERSARVEQDERLAAQIEQAGVEAFVDYWERIPLFESQQRLAHSTRLEIRRQRLSCSAIGLANSLRGMGTGVQPSWWHQLDTIKLPALLVTGELDKKFCTIAEKMQKLLPNSQHVVVPDAGHAVHVEQPEIFGTIVSDFLQRNGSSK